MSEALLACTKENTPYFTLCGEHECKCVGVYDGDTITVALKLGELFYKFRIRLLGIDAPELRTKNDAEKQKAIVVRDFLRGIVLNRIIKIKCEKFDKYGRVLAWVYLLNSEQSVNDLLIEKKYAKAYDGGTRQPYTDY